MNIDLRMKPAILALLLMWSVGGISSNLFAETSDGVWGGSQPLPELSGLSWREASSRLDYLRTDAQAAKNQGQLEQAANLYLELARSLPESPQTMEALALAAEVFAQAGIPGPALECCDAVIRLAKKLTEQDYIQPEDASEAPIKLQGAWSRPMIQEQLKKSLLEKTAILVRVQDLPETANTIRYYRAMFPGYPDLRAILESEAGLLGVDTEELRTRETHAWQLADEAKNARKQGNTAAAYDLLDQVLQRYPETGAALTSLRIKATMLWGHKQYTAFRATCTEILDRIGAIAPEAEPARFAAGRLAFLDAGVTYHRLLADYQIQAIGPDDWQHLRDLCREAMAKDKDPLIRATSHAVLISSLFWERDFEKVVVAEERFFDLHYKRKYLASTEFRRLFITTEVNTAESLRQLERYPEALQVCERLISLVESEPYLPVVDVERTRLYAHFLRCVILVKLGRPLHEVQQAVEAYAAQFPGSSYLPRLRSMLVR